MKTSLSRKIFLVIAGAMLIGICFLCLYPVWYVVVASFSDANKMMAHSGPLWWPIDPTLDAYRAVARNPMIGTGYITTLIVLVVGVAVNLLMSTLGAFFLSRKNVMLKTAIMKMIMLTMFFGGGMIPVYLTVRNLGLYDTLWALILPGAISTYNMIIMRTFFQGIPDGLEEAALIDGAGHLTILVKVFLPLSGSVMAVMLLYYGVAHWNSWFPAMMYIQDRDKFPLQLVLMEILVQNNTDSMAAGGGAVDDSAQLARTIKYATIVVSTVPILCLYPFLQKYFVKGVLVGSLKG